MKDWCFGRWARPLVVVGVVSWIAAFSSEVQGQSVVEGAFVGSIFAGSAVSGTLDAGDATLGDGTFVETWAYTLTTPGFVSIDLNSAAFDTYLFIALPDDTILAENDDCTPGEFDHSCISDMPAVAGTYYVGINTFSVGETGDYTALLSFTPLNQTPEPGVPLLLAIGAMGFLRRRRR